MIYVHFVKERDRLYIQKLDETESLWLQSKLWRTPPSLVLRTICFPDHHYHWHLSLVQSHIVRWIWQSHVRVLCCRAQKLPWWANTRCEVEIEICPVQITERPMDMKQQRSDGSGDMMWGKEADSRTRDGPKNGFSYSNTTAEER